MRGYTRELSLFLNETYRQKGVAVMAGEGAIGLEARGDRFALKIRNLQAGSEQEIVVDGVVAGIGTQPNVELAQAAGLAIENGIVVDELLRTSHPDIYAAGDVAAFTNPALGKRMRVEHEDNANTMGRQAGRAMAGAGENRIRTCRTFTPTFSSWAMKQSANWMRGTRLWQIGWNRSARVWSIICSQGGCAACSCGMSGIRWKRRGS